MRPLAATWAVLLLLLTACGADQQDASASAPPALTESPTATAAPTPRATPAPTPTPSTEPSLVPYEADPSTIVGAWRDRDGHFIEYFDTGRFTVDGGGTDVGTYTFDGTTLTYSSSDRGNCSGLEGMYDVTFYEDGELAELALVRDQCTGRSSAIAQGGLHRRAGS